MVDKWNVFNLTDFVGVLSYDTEAETFDFEVVGTSERAQKALIRLNVHNGSDWIKGTLFNRIFPPNRVDAADLLRRIGLERYDAWEILKINHLMSCNDMIWMTKGTDPNEFFAVHPLAEYVRERGLVD